MANFNTEGEDFIEIEPFEFINECSSREIRELIIELKDRGNFDDVVEPPKDNISNTRYHWYPAIEKIRLNKHQLTTEEEEFIYNLAKKLV